MRLFRLLRPAKQSARRVAHLVTGERPRSGENSTHAERTKVVNGYPQGQRLPHNAPQPDDDAAAPPAVMPIEMLDARDDRGEPVYPTGAGLPEEARYAWAYIRASQDVVWLCHTQRFRDADGASARTAGGTQLPPALGTVNPARAAAHVAAHDARGAAPPRWRHPQALFDSVLGKHRETPAVLRSPGSFPSEETTSIAHQWEFISPLNLGAARAQARAEGKMLYYVAAHDDEEATAESRLVYPEAP